MEDINNYKAFCDRLEILIKDEKFPEENSKTVDFLEAMQAWLNDTDGGMDFDQKYPGYISWQDLLDLIHIASIYE